jgi:prefoldin alpha subunit
MSEQEQRAQQLSYIYRELQSQLDALNEQLAYLDNSQTGISLTQQTIEELRKVGPDHEMIIPIGNSAFTKVKLVNPDNYVMSIGKNVLVERTAEQSLLIARKISDDYANYRKVLEEKIQTIMQKIEQIRPQIEQYMDQNESQPSPQQPKQKR